MVVAAHLTTTCRLGDAEEVPDDGGRDMSDRSSGRVEHGAAFFLVVSCGASTSGADCRSCDFASSPPRASSSLRSADGHELYEAR